MWISPSLVLFRTCWESRHDLRPLSYLVSLIPNKTMSVILHGWTWDLAQWGERRWVQDDDACLGSSVRNNYSLLCDPVVLYVLFCFCDCSNHSLVCIMSSYWRVYQLLSRFNTNSSNFSTFVWKFLTPTSCCSSRANKYCTMVLWSQDWV